MIATDAAAFVMNDERDSPATINALESGAATGSEGTLATTPTNPGDWLKQERERQGLAIQRIAADMHLSVSAIEAIEANRFATLGAPVFAKGHLRKYASLLGLPVDKIAELYARLDDAPRQVDPVPVTQRTPEPALRPAIREMLNFSPDSKHKPQQTWPWIVTTLFVGLVAAGLAWWYFGHHAPTAISTAIAIPERAKIESMRSGESEGAAASTSTLQRDRVVPAAALATPVRSTRSMGAPPPGKLRVRLTFARESWVEVYDARGNRMLYDVGKTDFPRLIDVEPPALVVLGDAGAVTTEANDKVVTIPPRKISGTVARFTIAADGTIK